MSTCTHGDDPRGTCRQCERLAGVIADRRADLKRTKDRADAHTKAGGIWAPFAAGALQLAADLEREIAQLEAQLHAHQHTPAARPRS